VKARKTNAMRIGKRGVAIDSHLSLFVDGVFMLKESPGFDLGAFIISVRTCHIIVQKREHYLGKSHRVHRD
jgi:hypothetical protein